MLGAGWRPAEGRGARAGLQEGGRGAVGGVPGTGRGGGMHRGASDQKARQKEAAPQHIKLPPRALQSSQAHLAPGLRHQ